MLDKKGRMDLWQKGLMLAQLMIATVFMAQKKIGIKYCGGCNPNYERVEMIQKVQSLFGDRFLFLRYDQQDLDMLVLMNGCSRACADKNLNPTEVSHHSITAEGDAETLIDWLMALKEKGDF